MDREMEVLFEDFNLVPDGNTETTGNAGERYVDLLASHSQEPGRYIDSAYTPNSGVWEGDYVFAGKGGTVVIQPVSGQVGGMIRTPLGDYSGDITVSVRFRASTTFWLTQDDEYLTVDGSSMSMSLGIGGYDSNRYPFTDIGDYPSMSTPQIYPNDGWQTFTFTFRNEGAHNDGFITFFTRNAIEIDWIKITDAATYLAAPAINPVTDFTEDGFTINWQGVRRAYNYYVDLWTSGYLSDEDYSADYDFEDGKLPEGAVLDGGSIAEGEGKDSSFGACIAKEGEEGAFILPEAPAKIKTLTFNAKFMVDNEDYQPSLIIDGLSEEGWRPLAQLDFDGLVIRNNKYREIKLNQPEVADKYTSVRFYAANLGEGNNVYLDNISVTGGRPFGLVRVMGENSMISDPDNDDYPYNFYDFTKNWKTTSLQVTGLDPEKEYYYRVRSHNVSEFSTSAKYHAFGVATPSFEEPAEIGSTYYTARWKDVAKAQNYTIRNFKAWKAEKDMEEAVILTEAFGNSHFDGSGNSLQAIGNSEESSLDEYTDMPGWTGRNNSVGENMIGCAPNSNGFITSPILMVNPYRGNFMLYIEAQGTPKDILKIRFNESTLYANVPFDDNGRISGVIEVPEVICGERVKFSADQGFALRAFEISQDVNKGDIIRTFAGLAEEPAGVESHSFKGLERGGLYTYDVIAHYTYEDKSTSSKVKDFMLVDLGEGKSQFVDKADINAEQAVETARYDINGMPVDSSYKGLVIIRYSDGTVRKAFVK